MDFVRGLFALAQFHDSHGDDGIGQDFFGDGSHACIVQKLKLAIFI